MMKSTLSPLRRPERKRKDNGAGERLPVPGHTVKETVGSYLLLKMADTKIPLIAVSCNLTFLNNELLL